MLAGRHPQAGTGRRSEEEPGTGTAFREFDPDLADLVPVQGGNGPGQAVPFHLVADDRLAADFLGDEAAQVLLAIHASSFRP